MLRARSARTVHPSPTIDAIRHGQEPLTVIHDSTDNARYSVRRPPTDIDKTIRLSTLDFLVSVVGLLMLSTDVVRSGLRTMNIYKRVEPNKYLSYGPSNYQVTDIIANRSADSDAVSFTAIKGGAAQPTVKLWSYKYDTLSIPSRTLVAYLNESLYPPCVLYRSECEDPLWLKPATVFGMMDGLIDAIDHELYHEDPYNKAPLVFMTKNVWIDRLHHFLVSPFSTHVQTRMHHVYHLRSGDNRPSRLCAPPQRHRWKHTGAYQRPMFCDLLKYWTCPDESMNRSMTILAHIEARFALLQRQHPDLSFDVTIYTTQRISTNRYSWNSLVHPQAFLRHTASEVTTWMRGRKCVNGDCVTTFLSDYRYEIATIDHNAAEWFPITGTLRAWGQVYVWLRLAMLFRGAYMTRLVEPQSANCTYTQLLGRALQTFLFIPAQALVYGSWVPVLAHALAHTIDGCIIHYCGESLWATVDAARSAPLETQIQRMSIQMRNTWYLALVLQVWVWVQVNVLHHRQVPWRYAKGIRGSRLFLITAVSALTVFSSVRKLTFRDSRVVERHLLPHKFLSPYSAGLMDGYAMAVGPWFDMKTLLLSSCVIWLCVMVAFAIAKFGLLIMGCGSIRYRNLQQVVTLASMRDGLFPHTHYVPLSAGPLWSINMHAVHWRPHRCGVIAEKAHAASINSVTSVGSTLSLLSLSAEANPVDSNSEPTTVATCTACAGGLGCSTHEPIYDVQHRTTTIWSIFRVLNLAMMTDPIVFVQLRFLGRRLYVYQAISPSAEPDVVVLPSSPALIDSINESHDTNIKLVCVILTNDIDWEHLLLCG